jgi:D-3-phosphoglycerate dehydrogenase / 2-oxoglutarate reductase
VNMARRRVALVSEIARLGRDQLDGLEDQFELVDSYELDNVRDLDRLAAGLESTWAVVAGSESYTGPLLDRLPDLRLIARCGVGFDAIDVEAATARGVLVSTTADANAEGVADLTLTLMLACLRRVLLGHRSARAGTWRPPGLAGDLSGATVGIVGLGRVGGSVARRLHGFGCRLLAVEPYPDHELCRELGIELFELRTMLPQADVLTIHTPLTADTKTLLGADELALLPPTAVLVNTSRGGVIDEPALIDMLASGRLAGAGLDVFTSEPLAAGHPLTQLDNVVLSPHAASFSRRTVRRMLESVRASLTNAAAGALPEGCLNPEVGP